LPATQQAVYLRWERCANLPTRLAASERQRRGQLNNKRNINHDKDIMSIFSNLIEQSIKPKGYTGRIMLNTKKQNIICCLKDTSNKITDVLHPFITH